MSIYPVPSVSVDPKTSRKYVKGTKARNNLKSDGFQCKQCGKIYMHLINLRLHSKIHTDSCYICSYCQKRFGRKGNYYEHLRVHTNVSPFECKICHKRYKQRHGLKKHMKVHG